MNTSSMRISLAAAAAFGLIAAGAAEAASQQPQQVATSGSQSSQSSGNSNASNNASGDSNPMKSLNQHSLRAQLKQNLSNSGFTDIKIIPSSFYIQAKNKKGEPVAMVIGPDTFTAVTEIKTQGANNSQASNKPQGPQKSSQK